MMNEKKCFRFVKNNMHSINGKKIWKIGQWQKSNGKIEVGANGLHANFTPIASLRNNYGEKWFIAEAKGRIEKKEGKFASSEMRLIQEIPIIVLQKFAIWCGKDSLNLFKAEQLELKKLLEASEDYLNGKAKIEKVATLQKNIIVNGVKGPTSRTVAVVIAASNTILAPNVAAWANAAATGSHAVHLAVDANNFIMRLAEDYNNITNVESIAKVARLSNRVTEAIHKSASAGSKAHAATVLAARNEFPTELASDPYYSSFAAFSFIDEDKYLIEQNEQLIELIEKNI
jgi:hypothetical protein